jgi:ABC-type sulfate transport system substrate-binding protein
MAEIPKYFSEDKEKHSGSKRQEKRLAKKLDGRRQKGSGAMAGHKADVKTVELLTECKRTEKKGIRITRDWLEKVSKEADYYGKIPALSIEFSDKRVFDRQSAREDDQRLDYGSRGIHARAAGCVQRARGVR